MTAPIRDLQELLEALRLAQLERDLSNEAVDELAGLTRGHVSKILGPNPTKGLGRVSLGPVLGALGKALVLLDDPVAIAQVQSRWSKRSVRGGAVVQLRERASRTVSKASSSTSSSIGDQMRKIRKLVKKENLVKAGKNGGKRRAKKMKARARQAVASHAARTRWARRLAGTATGGPPQL